jgi:hypothetical protein
MGIEAVVFFGDKDNRRSGCHQNAIKVLVLVDRYEVSRR